jgi:urease accessory protein
MKRDTLVQRGDRPFVFTNMVTGEGLNSIIAFIKDRGMLKDY